VRRLPGQGNSVAAFGPVALKPAATLACPIVSALDRWLADSVQPAAMRWFGQRVVEIKQISAYSCRGMNGNSHAHISEHAAPAISGVGVSPPSASASEPSSVGSSSPA